MNPRANAAHRTKRKAVNDKDGTPLVFDSGDFKGQTKLKRETKAIPAPDVQEAKIGLHRDSFYGR